MTVNSKDISLSIQIVSVVFLTILQETMEVPEKFLLVSSANDELHKKQHASETSEGDKKSLRSTQTVYKRCCSKNAFKYSVFSNLTALSTATKPKK